jgi:hypothetical protein
MIELIPVHAGVSWHVSRMLKMSSKRRFTLAMLLWSLTIKVWAWAVAGDGVLVEIHIKERSR